MKNLEDKIKNRLVNEKKEADQILKNHLNNKDATLKDFYLRQYAKSQERIFVLEDLLSDNN